MFPNMWPNRNTDWTISLLWLMQPGVSPQGRETGSGSGSRRDRAAWFLPPHPAKAVSALNRCTEREEQLFGLQPQDRQHDSSEQEHGECTMFLSVRLKGGKSHSGAATCYRPTQWFLPLPGLWRTSTQTHTHTHTHTHRVMNRGCNDSRVCLSEHFVFHWVNSDVRCLCICVPASVCVTGKQQGMESSDQRHAEGARTHQSEEQVLTRRLPRLILAALVRRKLVSSVYHLLCVLWPFSKKSPRVTTCKHCSFYCLLSFSCFSVRQQCCQT